MKNRKIIIPIIVLLVGLGAGFFGGIEFRNFQMSKARANFTVGGPNGNFQRFIGNGNGQGGNLMRGGAVSGSILSMDANSITVELADGSSKIVFFSGTTTYMNTISVAQTDLKVGTEVVVIGTANSDGSVTANSIQINPQFGKEAQPDPNPS